MKLDDLARRAAAEVEEASRKARFTVRPPGSRPLRARPATAFAAAAIVLAVGLPVLLVYGPWGNRVTDVPVTTTTEATTTTAEVVTTTGVATTSTTESTTTTVAGKTPAATVEELVAALYAATNAKDNDAVWALHTDDALHPFYYVEGRTGSIADTITPGYDLASDPLQGVEVLGEPLVSGDVVVVPVRWTYPASGLGVLTGFDVIVVSHVEGGLLVGGAATLFADDRPDLVVDPAEALAVIEASSAAFNADDVEGVLAAMTGDAVLWEDVTNPGVNAIHGGTAALQVFLTQSFFFTVELTGAPVVSGRFFALPSRNTVEATGAFYDGVYLFWIRDGKIALQAWAEGG